MNKNCAHFLRAGHFLGSSSQVACSTSITGAAGVEGAVSTSASFMDALLMVMVCQKAEKLVGFQT
jgi:hypothetical protein